PAFPTLSDPSQNPYYVHPNESATAALVTPPLDGKNYHAWSRSMMKAVIMKNKLRFLDGSCPMPDRFDPSYEPWIRCNNLVLSWLMNSVIPAISQSLVYTDSASQAWNDLKARFSRADRNFSQN
ncbi:retrovirus-related Pol polyprotein from transposon TNT 1-94, partial [Trifolium pratense]